MAATAALAGNLWADAQVMRARSLSLSLWFCQSDAKNDAAAAASACDVALLLLAVATAASICLVYFYTQKFQWFLGVRQQQIH